MTILLKVLPLFVAFLTAYFLKRGEVLKKEDGEAVGKLIIWLVAPAVIAKSLAQATITPNLLYLPIIAVLAVLSLLAIGYGFSRLLNLQGKTRGSFIIAFPTLEGGTIGYAVMLAAFGELGLARIALFDSANAILEFTLIYFIAAVLGRNIQGKVSVRESLGKVFKTPLVWAVFAGFFLNLAHIQNQTFYGVFDVMGAGLVFLAMALVGLEFEPKVKSFRLPAVAIALKAASGLAVGFAFARLFGLTGLERTAVIVGASLPPSILSLVFAKNNALDTEFTADLLAIGLPFSLVFLSALLYFI